MILLEAAARLQRDWTKLSLQHRLFIHAQLMIPAFLAWLVIGPCMSPEEVPMWWVIGVVIIVGYGIITASIGCIIACHFDDEDIYR